ncbi:hypothetical protein FUAX_40820 (plasmid) [Fulvitalea axinellae]|uniref:Phage tail tape measure protein domain-containing protein n=1 Tax=Fulvitalea axinellae TaxID=1182444 RepID=A0AAU9DK78_9BACT|nr:hypothetical protein FUAX_40820 [Fulvitalea axinellae]
MSSQGYSYKIDVDTNGNAVLPSLVNNAERADASLNRFTKDANGRLRDANGRFVTLGRSAEGVRRKVGGLGPASIRGLGTLERRAKAGTGAMAGLRSMVAGLGLTLSTGALATGLVGTGAGFEKSMSNVQALSNATRTEMVGLKAAAREAGDTTVFSARQSADGMGYLALAGFKADQQIQALPATLNLAAAGGMELARSADIATNILSQYRMKASQTGVVVDQLAFTQSRFNTNIEEASDAMNYWGPTAKAMGVGLAESNATIGLLANNGLKGSLATRALGTSIVRLTKPTKAMRGVMDELNLSFFNGEGRFIGMSGMIGMLNERMAGLNDKQRQAALSTVFGSEAIQEMNILLAEGSEKIRYWTGELENAEGTAKRMADTKLDNLAGDFQMLKSATQEASLKIYDQLGPSLRSATKDATGFVRAMDTKEVGLYMTSLVTKGKKAVGFLFKHRKTVLGLAKAVLVLKSATLAYAVGLRIETGLLAAARTAKFAYITATRGATVALRAMNTTMMASPTGLILAGITAVTAAIVLLSKKTKKATEAQVSLNEAQRKSDESKKDRLGTEKATDLDLKKSKLEGLTNDQIAGLKRRAKARIAEIKDQRVDMRLQYQDEVGLRKKHVPKVWEAIQKEEKEIEEWKKSKLPAHDKRNAIRYHRERKKDLEAQYGKMTDSGFMSRYVKESGRLNKTLKKNEELLSWTLKRLPEKQDSPLGGPLTTGGKDDKKMSENIISGGASQRIINIQVDKFQDAINFHVKEAVGDLADKAEDMEELMNEAWARTLNTANQAAHGGI